VREECGKVIEIMKVTTFSECSPNRKIRMCEFVM